MTIFGIDVSRHQQGINLAEVAQASNIDFVMAKLTEGVGWQDPEFGVFLSQAQETDLLFAAYHYLRGDSLPGDQARNVRNALGGADIPVILDVERTNGAPQPSMNDVRLFTAVAEDLGVRVARLLYLPEWYWNEIGRPDTGGWSIWQSDYGPNDKVYPGDASERWSTMGRQASILQFTSNGGLRGYSGTLDVNAYRGSRAELTQTGWFYDMKEHEVATKSEIQSWVAETPIVVDPKTGETQQLQRVLRRILADPAPTVDEIADAVVAVLPEDRDLTRKDVKEAMRRVLSERAGS